MLDIDKWFMEQCGETEADYEWGIDDANCREIIRSKFRIVTNCDEVTGAKTDSEWEAECCVQHKDYISCKTGYGESIKEAEIDLLNRIYKAR